MNVVGDPIYTQTFRRPVVYLDHWAIRMIADDAILANRYATALKRVGGTWAVSWFNFCEFIGMTDEEQAANFEALLELVFPHIFFIESVAFNVIDRERERLQGIGHGAPYGDVDMLQFFAGATGNLPSLFKATGVVTTIVRRRDELAGGFEAMKKASVVRVQAMRDELKVDDNLAKLVSGSHKVAETQPAWLFTRELIGTVMMQPQSKFDTHDAMDLFHTVVPVAYCDIVLLDNSWRHRVEMVRQRLFKHGITLKPAEVFSKRDGSIEPFFVRLESLADV